MNWKRLSFRFDRYARALVTAVAFVAVLFGCIALMDWARSIESFWLKLFIAPAAALIVGALIALFFRKTPKVF